jgi:hypothetical protein
VSSDLGFHFLKETEEPTEQEKAEDAGGKDYHE